MDSTQNLKNLYERIKHHTVMLDFNDNVYLTQHINYIANSLYITILNKSGNSITFSLHSTTYFEVYDHIDCEGQETGKISVVNINNNATNKAIFIDTDYV